MSHCSELVANRVLDAERDEVETLETATASTDPYLNRAGRAEPVGPCHAKGSTVDVIFCPMVAAPDLPQDSARNPTCKIHPIEQRPRTLKRYPSFGPPGPVYPQLPKFLLEHAFQAARAW